MRTFQEWFGSLPVQRRQLLIDDKWMLANAAFEYEKAERDALALENRKLKMFGAEVDAIMRNQDNIWSRQISALCEKVDFAINQDIKMLLAAHDAEVTENAVNDFCEWMLLSKRYSVAEWCGEYTEQLRTKTK